MAFETLLIIKAILGSFGIAVSIASLLQAIAIGVAIGAIIVLISLAIPISDDEDFDADC